MQRKNKRSRGDDFFPGKNISDSFSLFYGGLFLPPILSSISSFWDPCIALSLLFHPRISLSLWHRLSFSLICLLTLSFCWLSDRTLSPQSPLSSLDLQVSHPLLLHLYLRYWWDRSREWIGYYQILAVISSSLPLILNLIILHQLSRLSLLRFMWRWIQWLQQHMTHEYMRSWEWWMRERERSYT